MTKQKHLSLLGVLFLWVSPVLGANKVVRLPIQGIINPVIGDYVKEGLRRASESNADAVLIELDTPGGMLNTTRTLAGLIMNADQPVILYVYPKGSRATSAGVFLMMSADIAAMSPGTHLGAAHPVTMGPLGPQEGPNDPKAGPSVMDEKILSDAVAFMKSLATDHGRNAQWAEQAVRQSVSLTAEEALKNKVIDNLADSPQQLLDQIDGKTIKKNGKTITLHTKQADIQTYPMSVLKSLLQMLAHPNVAYILLLLGIYGLVHEFTAPGTGLGGAMAAICLLLAFFSLEIMPINTVGVILIIFGAGLLIIEALTPAHGLLIAGGLIAFTFGSLLLIDVHHNLPYPGVSPSLIFSTVIASGAILGVFIHKIYVARHSPPQTGAESLLGAIAIVKREIAPEGTVFLNGELWNARAEEPVGVDKRVEVIGQEGNTLIVRSKN